MNKKVTIKVHDVGQAFGHEARVRTTPGHRLVHTTRLVPQGMRGVAYDLALAWAKENGYELWEENGK